MSIVLPENTTVKSPGDKFLKFVGQAGNALHSWAMRLKIQREEAKITAEEWARITDLTIPLTPRDRPEVQAARVMHTHIAAARRPMWSTADT